MAQFALSGLLATLVIGLAAVAVIRQTGTEEAINDAKKVTSLAGRGIVGPALTRAALDGDPAALRSLDRLVRERVRQDGIVRVKIWSAAGRVVYSDEMRLVGRTFELGQDERDAFHSGATDAELSHLSGPENRFERSQGKLLEVYLPIAGPDGKPLLFEAYHRFGSVSSSGRRLWLLFAPALLGGLLLLQLVHLPLAHSLARRLRQGQHEREALLRRALDASHTERRRIAADLHDGVVQDLVGVGYTLAAQAERLNGHGDRAVSAALVQGAAQTRHSVRALRTLLVDIYPPALRQSGLVPALEDLARTFTARGMHTTVEAPDDLGLDDQSEQLLFRCAQETLRNSAKHAGALHAAVTIEATDDATILTVSDDGSGFDPVLLDEAKDGGHFGIRVLRDLVEENGGRFELRSSPGTGTETRIALPHR